MAESLTSIAVKLERSIGALNTHVAEDQAFHREALHTMSTINASVEGVKTDIADLKKTPMRLLRWLGGFIAAGAAITNIVTYVTHEETVAKATQANNVAVAAATNSTVATTKLTHKVDAALGIPSNSTDP